MNRKYTPTKKNGGCIPIPKDPRVLYVPVGCGNCIECRKQKSREWNVRLNEDIKMNKNAHFVTLTFSNESYKRLHDTVRQKPCLRVTTKKLLRQHFNVLKYHTPKLYLSGYALDNAIATKAVRLFLERWRKKYKKSLRHWLVTELGHNGTENIHLHGIVYADNIKELKNIWSYGYVWDGYNKNGQRINYVNAKTINYITKYVTKTDLHHKYYKSIILASPGIGANYTNTANSKRNKYNEKDTKQYYIQNGPKLALPIYYRNKIYSDDEKEQLWLNRLDEHTRYVCGEKIDVSKSYDNYFKALDYHRERNKQLGFGDDKIDWNRKKYEDEIRTIKQAARINSQQP